MNIEGSQSGSISQRHGSADPDPHQNVMDPQQCPQYFVKRFFKNRSWIFIALPRFYVRQEGVKITGPYYLTLSVGALKHLHVPVSTGRQNITRSANETQHTLVKCPCCLQL
jgi:hypothetical protein